MNILLIALYVLGGCALLLALFYRRRDKRGKEAPQEEAPKISPMDMECCGQHEVCEKDKLIKAMQEKIIYFDDEELDRFKGVAADAYTDEQTEEFREVLYTMQPREVNEWIHSLQLRQIELPTALREEVILLINNN